jgi:hypothetical protein
MYFKLKENVDGWYLSCWWSTRRGIAGYMMEVHVLGFSRSQIIGPADRHIPSGWLGLPKNWIFA